MSTKAIRRALGLVMGHERIPTGDELRAAYTELEAIRKAAKVLTQDCRDGQMDIRMANELLASIAKDAP